MADCAVLPGRYPVQLQFPVNTPPALAGGVELGSMCAWLIASHVAVSMFTPNVVLICYAIPWVSEPWAVSFQFSDGLGEFPQWAL